ncbi:mucin-3A-like [Octopus sinensis]|uniref:Mucin-3A-like n=1 Tax=Octopus sinensis TaxID=2607531 RepID=A0A6P7U2Q5_9MOLL|nr:mucin-3A-like [Octopus sinensis]
MTSATCSVVFVVCILQCVTSMGSQRLQPSKTLTDPIQTQILSSSVAASNTLRTSQIVSSPPSSDDALKSQTSLEPSQTLTAPKTLSKSSISTLYGITGSTRSLLHDTSALAGTPTHALPKSLRTETPVLSRSLPIIPENTMTPTKSVKLTDDSTALSPQRTSAGSVLIPTTTSTEQEHPPSKSFVVLSSSVVNKVEHVERSTKMFSHSSLANVHLTPLMTSDMISSAHSSTIQPSPSLATPQKTDVTSTLLVPSRVMLSEGTHLTAQSSQSSVTHSVTPSDQSTSPPVRLTTQPNIPSSADSVTPSTTLFVGRNKSVDPGRTSSVPPMVPPTNLPTSTNNIPTNTISTQADFASKINSQPFLVSSSSLSLSSRIESTPQDSSVSLLSQGSSASQQTTSLPFTPNSKATLLSSESQKTDGTYEITSPISTPTLNPQLVETKWSSSLESGKFTETSLSSNSNKSSTAFPELATSNVRVTDSLLESSSPISLTQTVIPSETEPISLTLSVTSSPYMSSNLSHLELLKPSHSTSYNTMSMYTSSVELHSALTTIVTEIIPTRTKVNMSRTYFNASNTSGLVFSTTNTVLLSVSSSQIGIPILSRSTQYSKLLKSSKTLSADSTISKHSSTVTVYSITPSNSETQMHTHVSHLTKTVIKTTNSTPLGASTTLPPRNKTFEIVFNGLCTPLAERHLYGQFSDNIRYIVSRKLSISYDSVVVHNLTCASVHVYVTLLNTVTKRITENFKELVGSRKLNISVISKQGELHYSAVKLKTIAEPSVQKELQSNAYEKDSKTSVITIACSAIVAMLVIGLVVALRECYRRKHTQTFDLTNTPNVHMKLEDFTLTRIPRSSTWYSDEGVAIQRFSETNGSTMQKSSNGISKQPTISCISDILKDKEADGEELRPFSYSILSNNSRKDSQDTTVSITSDSNFAYSTDSLVPLPKSSSGMHGAVNPIYFGDEMPQMGSNNRLDQNVNPSDTHEQFRQVYNQ